ncbi:Wzz/FepE/Etk N-terminal domain-containing protein [Mucilaginibacter sp. X4EP1]|uniref:Wzz/FepE/Etk N-terminal domain-containing protein n=1 Tax=Mucilaginibacter sp. X4EP1 TaxID=2723092 RepID=UPI002169BE5C|nr:Wzz/FepE/Etk N-terminal domain-containing protein [Mucilaginibacter sp. X4EP1]MCS3812765.1 uncharacterized protein involved in exopolysaccharide biosynthesis [Mucilaginibacter sp. X4EP1]
MNQSDQERKINKSGEITFSDLMKAIENAGQYILQKWLIILMVSILGGIIGIVYSIYKKPTYTAVCTFVLEDSKSSSLSQYAGLASIAGLNVGGGSGGSIFEGDNIVELYKSRSMMEQALLSKCNFDGKSVRLIDRFLNYHNLYRKYKVDKIDFDNNPDNFNRKQDSIITDLVDVFNKKILSVSKPDKKLSIIRVEVVDNDELFSKYFTQNLVQTVNDFYIQTKTKKAYQNVLILQKQADSVRAILNSSISDVASAIDAAPNANPQMLTLKVSSQKKQIDVQTNSAIYGEIVKNLELEKVNLRQEMPLIQVIDKPVLPLPVKEVGKITALIAGIILGAMLAAVFLIIKRSLNKA